MLKKVTCQGGEKFQNKGNNRKRREQQGWKNTENKKMVKIRIIQTVTMELEDVPGQGNIWYSLAGQQ